MPVLLDELTGLQHLARFIIVAWRQRSNAPESKVIGENRPALAHALGFRLVGDIEDLPAARAVWVQRSPDDALGDGRGRSFIVERRVRFLSAREGNAGAFAVDECVEGEVGGPEGGEVEGAAVGDETDLIHAIPCEGASQVAKILSYLPPRRAGCRTSSIVCLHWRFQARRA